jgi:hypothetical protein
VSGAEVSASGGAGPGGLGWLVPGRGRDEDELAARPGTELVPFGSVRFLVPSGQTGLVRKGKAPPFDSGQDEAEDKGDRGRRM